MALHVLVMHLRVHLSSIVVMPPIYLISDGLPWGSKQWGMTTDNGKNKDYWEYTFPLAMGRAFIAALTRASGAYGYIAKVTGLTGTYLRWTDTDSSNQHGSGDIMYCIIIGTL